MKDLIDLKTAPLHPLLRRSAALGYTKEGPMMLRELSTKMVANTLFLRNEAVSASIVEHITALLRAEPETIRDATLGDGALSLEEATRESNIRLDFFCSSMHSLRFDFVIADHCCV